MKKIGKKDILLLVMQLAVWAAIISVPALTAYVTTHDWKNVRATTWATVFMLQSPLVIYFANFYLLHHLFFRRRYVWFALLNLVLMLGLNFGLFYIRYFTHNMPYFAKLNMYMGLFVFMLFNCAMIATAVGIRHFMRTNRLKQQLAEQRQKTTEAELAWLKNQINPHFLFNTLNNISSLTQIDPDKAQEAIAQLSDLLHYAMYETDKQDVPLRGEVEFMRNYVELMRLRCNSKTSVEFTTDIENEQAPVAPLLFISLVENAFKHGTSTSRPSLVNISMVQRDNALTFTCDNTNYPKSDTDRSGSGIGIENTRRRLQLLYPGRFDWQQEVTADNIYHTQITIRP